jgi:cell fate (sporulation/competence/biofilm development) regulator YlbF (YheA/YmcA/DUF963 family)
MPENINEAARYFEKAFRESNEYKSFQKLCNELKTDPEAKQIFIQMNQLNSQLQQKQMAGQELRPQEVEVLNNMQAVAQQNEKIQRFVEAEYRVSMILMDLNKIISKPLEELYGQLVGK